MNQVRDLTGFSDYKIAKEYKINQSNLSKYSSGKAALSETHAFLFADILGLNPIEVMIATKIEHASNTSNDERLKFWQKQLENIKPIHSQARVIISQFNPTVGDIKGNTEKIIDLVKKASSNHDLIIFPELSICGYPPEDLLFHQGFSKQINDNIAIITEYSYNIDIIIGTPTFVGYKIYNSALLLRDGVIFGTYNKQKLPNYGVFDEKRYFTAGSNPFIFNLMGNTFAILICEDAWSDKIIKNNKNIGADTIISINASPYSLNKYTLRIDKISALAKKNHINIIYTNMIGAQDGLVFDGGSFIVNSVGKVINKMPFFTDGLFDLNNIYSNNYNEISNGYNALVLGLRDYFNKSDCFTGIIIALSGGIDSALTLSIAADAIGNDNVKAVMMPYIYTSNHSIKDARDQVKRMQIDYQEIDIESIVTSYKSSIPELKNIALENIQARVRGNIVMSIANNEKLLLLSTSNKSESSVGYTTLYGDMSGGFSPIKDVYKTTIYKLAKYRNTINDIIPQNVIKKEPSAELAPDQFDINTLPPYEILDKILNLFIENSLSIDKIIEHGFSESTVKRVISMVKNNEYKRFQSSIGTKFSDKSFDKERRYPIINKFNFFNGTM